MSMQEIEITRSKNIATHNVELENIHTAALEDAGFDKTLNFKKGKYYIGEEEVPLGTEYLAHPEGWTKTWTKYIDDEPPVRKVYRVALGEKPLEREKLDDLDLIGKKKADGMSADPWVLHYLLPFENVTNGEIVVFITQSFFGKRAVANLCKAYTRRVKRGYHGQPKIKLAGTVWLSPKFGEVPIPEFDVASWEDADSGNALPPAPTLQQELDDDIPNF